jgi:hypothetical protein
MSINLRIKWGLTFAVVSLLVGLTFSSVARGDAGQALILGQANTSATDTTLQGTLRVYGGYVQADHLVLGANTAVEHTENNGTNPMLLGCTTGSAAGLRIVFAQIQGQNHQGLLITGTTLVRNPDSSACIYASTNKAPAVGTRVDFILVGGSANG